jgi:Mg-chelatase subunit ChlD
MVEAIARRLANDNMTQLGAKAQLLEGLDIGIKTSDPNARDEEACIPSAGQVRADGTTPEYCVYIVGELPVPLVLLGFVPGLGQISKVNAKARLLANRVIVSLVLDVTGSMNLKENENDPNEVRPIEALKASAVRFLGFFREDSDWMAITTFSRDLLRFDKPEDQLARVIWPMSTRFRSARRAIEGIEADGKTSIAEGLQKGFEQIITIPEEIRANAKKYLVMFTDGAPNTGSEDFDRSKCGGIDEAKIPYLNAIRISDQIRAAGIEVVVLALGKQPTGTDIYQDVTDDKSLKPYLLRRIANTYDEEVEKKGIPYFECGIENYKTYNDPKNPNNQNGLPKKGTYADTDKASDLSKILSGVAEGIAPRLTE